MYGDDVKGCVLAHNDTEIGKVSYEEIYLEL